jgi:hypothetical protein
MAGTFLLSEMIPLQARVWTALPLIRQRVASACRSCGADGRGLAVCPECGFGSTELRPGEHAVPPELLTYQTATDHARDEGGGPAKEQRDLTLLLAVFGAIATAVAALLRLVTYGIAGGQPCPNKTRILLDIGRPHP